MTIWIFSPSPEWNYVGGMCVAVAVTFERAIELLGNHCGPFYLWGNGVPEIIPPECYKVKKGINLGNGSDLKGMTQEEKRIYRKQFPNMQVSGISKERKKYTAKWAAIPFSLSFYIGQFAMQSLAITVK